MSLAVKKRQLMKQSAITRNYGDEEGFVNATSVKPKRVSFEDDLSNSDGENMAVNKMTEKIEDYSLTKSFRQTIGDSMDEDEVVIPRPKGTSTRGGSNPEPAPRKHTNTSSQLLSRNDADTLTWNHSSHRPTPTSRRLRPPSLSEESDDSPRLAPKPHPRKLPQQITNEEIDHEPRNISLSDKLLGSALPNTRPRVSPRTQGKGMNNFEKQSYDRETSLHLKDRFAPRTKDSTLPLKSAADSEDESDDESDDEKVGKMVQLGGNSKTFSNSNKENKTFAVVALETKKNRKMTKSKYLEDDSDSGNEIAEFIETEKEESVVEKPKPAKRTYKPIIPGLSSQEAEDNFSKSAMTTKGNTKVEGILSSSNRSKKLHLQEKSSPMPSPRTTKTSKKLTSDDKMSSQSSLAKDTRTQEPSKKSKALELLEKKAEETKFNKKPKNVIQLESKQEKILRETITPTTVRVKRSGSLDSIHDRLSTKYKNSPRDIDQQQNQNKAYRNALSPQKLSVARKENKQSEYDISSTLEDHAPWEGHQVDEKELHRKIDLYDTRKDTVERGYHQQMIYHKPREGLHSTSTPKRSPMKASRGVEEMTKSPQLRETLTPQSRAEKDSAYVNRLLSSKRSSSMTNLRSAIAGCDDSDEDAVQRNNSLDTEAIRQAVFLGWLSQKNENLKQKLSIKALEKKRKEEKEIEELQKKNEAKRAFQTWSERKTESLKEKQKRIKEQKKKEEEIELEKEVKRRDSQKYFDSWKAIKDDKLKEHHKKKMEERKNKKKLEEEEKDEKRKSAIKLFENWKTKKDEVIKKELREKRKKEKEKEDAKEDATYERTIKSAEEYESWVKRKGKPRKIPSSPNLTQRAWCPNSRNTGNCIPSSVVPVVQAPPRNRSRTLSGSERLKTIKMYSIR